MESQTQPQSTITEHPGCYCLLCLSEDPTLIKTLTAVRGEEGIRQNIEGLIRKYFPEELLELNGQICCSCNQQLKDFHQFYLRIKTIQWNRKMKTATGSESASNLVAFQMDTTIKEEKIDDTYRFDHSAADVEGLNNFLNEEFGSQPEHNGNGITQNRILDSIVNEFQSSSLENNNSTRGNENQPSPKRMKKTFFDLWPPINNLNSRLPSNTENAELELLEDEFHEYDKPPDEQIHQSHNVAAMDELERLRKENEWLKRRNHLLVTRLRDVHVRNSDLLQINRELTAKLRSYDPKLLGKPIPVSQDNTKTSAEALAHIKQQNSSIFTTPTLTASQQSRQGRDSDGSKFISLSGAYTLDNGDTVVQDSVIPCRTMLDIDAVEPGEKYDLKFISKLAVALWGYERLAVSSVTGRKSNNAGQNTPPSIQLEPEKLSFIKEKVYNRAMLETNDRLQAMARFDDSRINRLLNIKIQNAKRKKNLHYSAV
ncbi:uncharacterized protein LOC128737633 [Sabethes cyaneus]|uniref:uncharacterized protein LOC128737633 n=1 Tax=Sabethes cyaneus TaxID=53552 RepID=UPI00237D81E2|nr:uncharacterized protein LOC128737633 [Sabethes cyaneus]